MTLLSNIQRWWFAKERSNASLQLNDEALLTNYQLELSSSVMEVLINRHGDALFHFLLTLSDAHLAEDISQLTWLKIIEHPNRYVSKGASFRTWLFTNGRNSLIDELRRINRWQWTDVEDLSDEDQLSLAEEEIPASVTSEQFDAALSSLPFVQKEAIMLQLEGFSIDDIANITHEKLETIKSRLRFARKQLKQQLEVPNER